MVQRQARHALRNGQGYVEQLFNDNGTHSYIFIAQGAIQHSFCTQEFLWSGIPWSDSKGLNITVEMEETFDTYVKVCFRCSTTLSVC
jgi:hypothetical protein